MKIKYMQSEREPYVNDAILDYDAITPKDKNTLHIFHSNQDDSYYSYGFEMTGTAKEIEVIKEFCGKLMEANANES